MNVTGAEFAYNPTTVDDVPAARKELETKRVAFSADTIDSGVCHMAFVHDPVGNSLLLHDRYAPRRQLRALPAL